jgi:hypothetical protein
MVVMLLHLRPSTIASAVLFILLLLLLLLLLLVLPPLPLLLLLLPLVMLLLSVAPAMPVAATVYIKGCRQVCCGQVQLHRRCHALDVVQGGRTPRSGGLGV